MGMYTCLKFTGQLKKEYVEDIKKLFTDQGDRVDNFWTIFAEKYPFAKHFSELYRADFIPFGAFSAYNYDKAKSTTRDFCDLKQEPRFSNVVDGDDTDVYYESAGYDYAETWVFQCDLKNYEDEIEVFLNEIATVVCSKFIAEVWYEEFAFPTVYKFNLEPIELKGDNHD